MIKDGFPHAVAVWLGMAFATGLSFLVTFAFGGFPLPCHHPGSLSARIRNRLCHCPYDQYHQDADSDIIEYRHGVPRHLVEVC